MNQTDTFSTQQGSSSPSSASGSTGEVGSAGSTVRATAEKARRAAGKVANQAKDKVSQVADEQKGAAADTIGRYGSRLRDAARSTEEEDPNIAYFADQAADRLESVADYVRTTDLGRLKDDAAGIARRHPALFMGGMLIAGLIVGNLAKASVASLRETEFDDGEDFDEPYPDGHDAPANAEDDASYGGEVTEPIARDFPAANETSNPSTP